MYDAFRLSGTWTEQAATFWDSYELGFGPSPHQITPEEYQVLRIMRHHDKALTARITAQEFGKIVAAMFPGDKKKV